MKLIRSTKCSLKFSTEKKLKDLTTVIDEYGKVVNIFINHFWLNPNDANKSKLLKPIVDIPETWLSARLRKVAAREAIDMINASKQRWKDKPLKLVMPQHKGKRMYVSSTIADLVSTKNNDYKSEDSFRFDAWLHLASVGNKIILDLPIKYHKHFNKYNTIGKRLNSYIITKDYVQFSFEIITKEKRVGTDCIGVDTGINALASLNNGKQYGLDIKDCIKRVKRCKQKSNGYYQAKRALKQRIDEVLKIRNHIYNEYYPTYYVKETKTENKMSMYYILTDIYQDYYGKSDRYMQIILNTIQNIFQENYVVSQEAEFCLIDRTEHLARIGNMVEYKKTWLHLFKIFKFLKTMENVNFVSELINNPSYKLGVELAKFESGWKKGRENLQKTIELFTGNVSRVVFDTSDVMTYYQNLVERMTRNHIYAGDHNDLLSLLHTINNEDFDKTPFIMGYFTEKNEYKPTNKIEEN